MAGRQKSKTPRVMALTQLRASESLPPDDETAAAGIRSPAGGRHVPPLSSPLRGGHAGHWEAQGSRSSPHLAPLDVPPGHMPPVPASAGAKLQPMSVLGAQISRHASAPGESFRAAVSNRSGSEASPASMSASITPMSPGTRASRSNYLPMGLAGTTRRRLGERFAISRAGTFSDEVLEGRFSVPWLHPWWSTQIALCVLLWLPLIDGAVHCNHLNGPPIVLVGYWACLALLTLLIVQVLLLRRRVRRLDVLVMSQSTAADGDASERHHTAPKDATAVDEQHDQHPHHIGPRRISSHIHAEASGIARGFALKSWLACIFGCTWAVVQGMLVPMVLCDEQRADAALDDAVCKTFAAGAIPFAPVLPTGLGPWLLVLAFRMRTWPVVLLAVSCVTTSGVGAHLGLSHYDQPIGAAAVVTVIIICCNAFLVLLAHVLNTRERLHFATLQVFEEKSREREVALVRASEEHAERVRSDIRRRVVQNTIGYAAHELRNPIHALDNLLDNIRTSGSGTASDGTESDLWAAKQAVEHMKQVTSDVLDFAKAQAGQLQVHLGAARVRGVVEAIVAQFRRYAEASHRAEGGAPAEIELTIDDSVPAVAKLDSMRLSQLIANGLSNAIKHVSEGGKITCTVTSQALAHGNAELLVEVCNQGSGLGGIDVESLFEPYSQSEKDSVSTQVLGTGLGLPICRLLSKLLGGKVSLFDRGEWTVFAVQIPIQPASSSDVSIKEGVDLTSHESIKGMHVVIAEDEPTNRRILQRMLGRLGCTFTAFADGDEVDPAIYADLERTNSPTRPRVFLLDIVMKRQGGDVLCRRLREAGVRSAKIIATTANTSAAEIQRYKERCGFDDVLNKPFNVASLANALAGAAAESDASGTS